MIQLSEAYLKFHKNFLTPPQLLISKMMVCFYLIIIAIIFNFTIIINYNSQSYIMNIVNI
jgi:hypothetical protein